MCNCRRSVVSGMRKERSGGWGEYSMTGTACRAYGINILLVYRYYNSKSLFVYKKEKKHIKRKM